MVFFRDTGGGVTLSGGEPLIHGCFAAEFFRLCKDAGIDTAVETSGYVPLDTLRDVLPYTDLFLYDVKLFTRKKHEIWTGVSNERIVENLKWLADNARRVVVRVPLIPGVNDDDDEFSKIVGFVESLGGVREMSILPFHQLGASKYDAIGMDYSLRDLSEDNAERISRCFEIAKSRLPYAEVGGSEIMTEQDFRRKSNGEL